jgi:hypothetical protein
MMRVCFLSLFPFSLYTFWGLAAAARHLKPMILFFTRRLMDFAFFIQGIIILYYTHISIGSFYFRGYYIVVVVVVDAVWMQART